MQQRNEKQSHPYLKPGAAALVTAAALLAVLSAGHSAAPPADPALLAPMQSAVSAYNLRGSGELFATPPGSLQSGLVAGAPSLVSVKGDEAYLVVPAVLHYRQDTDLVSQQGQWLLVEKRQEGRWQIADQSWSVTAASRHPLFGAGRYF